MRAVTYREYGSPDVLAVREVATPVPGDDEVLVRVVASSVNDYDWHLLTGRPWLNRAPGFTKPANPVLGSDVAGRVEAVGAAVSRFAPGDAVYADMSPHGFGAFAEYVVAPQAAWPTSRQPCRSSRRRHSRKPASWPSWRARGGTRSTPGTKFLSTARVAGRGRSRFRSRWRPEPR